MHKMLVINVDELTDRLVTGLVETTMELSKRGLLLRSKKVLIKERKIDYASYSDNPQKRIVYFLSD